MNNSRLERRYSISIDNPNIADFRIKRVDSSSTTSRKIKIYASVFNQRSKIITEWVSDKNEYRTFYEIIDPKAFDNILANINNVDVLLNVNHQYNELLARTSSKTLSIGKDVKGLWGEADLPETARGEDVLIMSTRGDYFECSFSFIVAENGDSWTLDNETGIWTRLITNIETLIDICVATYRGAYSNTSIEVGKGKRTEYNEYQESDIAVAKRKLDELMKVEKRIETDINLDNSITNNDDEYLVELELDQDKLTLLS